MNSLDGRNILRYGHVYDGGGGLEQYLADLNDALCQRSALNLTQVQLTSHSSFVGESEQTVGRGRLRRVSLFVDRSSHEKAVAGSGQALTAATAWHRHIAFRPWVYSHFTRHAVKLRRAPRRAGEPDQPARAIAREHARAPIDLICFHSAGGADVDEILDFAQTQGIPAVYVHHFSNDRLASPSMSRQLDRLDGVAGVSPLGVPAFVQGKFFNVSDGIDTRFFARRREETLTPSTPPVIFLPSRITPAKGQADAVRAAGALKRRGLGTKLVLAGRIDSPIFLSELRELIQSEGLDGAVEFPGDLDPVSLREWYARATVVAFPTRHHEGLGRILLECQSMEVPPVVYNIGGTPDGVRDGETGFLVQMGDLDEFVDRLAVLLTNDSLRLRMAEAAREFVIKQFSIEALAARHERFYGPFLRLPRLAGGTLAARR